MEPGWKVSLASLNKSLLSRERLSNPVWLLVHSCPVYRVSETSCYHELEPGERTGLSSISEDGLYVLLEIKLFLT